MINVRMAEKTDISKNEIVNKAVEDVEAKLADTGRVLLRPSGTEPVVRVMVEGRDPVEVDALTKELAAVVEKALK